MQRNKIITRLKIFSKVNINLFFLSLILYIGLTLTELFSYVFLLRTVIILSILLYHIVILYSVKGGPLENQLC